MENKDESYLDSLLNSVIESDPMSKHQRPKRSIRQSGGTDKHDNVKKIQEEMISEMQVKQKEILEHKNDETSKDTNFDNINIEDEKIDYEIDPDYNIFTEDDSYIDNLLAEDSYIYDEELEDVSLSESNESESDMNEINDDKEDLTDNKLVMHDMIPVESKKDESGFTEQELDDSMNLGPEEMSNGTAVPQLMDEENVEDLFNDLFQDMGQTEKKESNDDDDIMHLLNSITNEESGHTSRSEEASQTNNEEDIGEDILSISKYLDEIGISQQDIPDNKDTDQQDTVETVEDDIDLLNLIPDIEDRTQKKSISKEKKKGKNDNKEKNLFKRLFGNLPDDRTEEEIVKLKEKVISDYDSKEQEEINKKEKKVLDAKAKEEKKKLDAEEAKAKKAEKTKKNAEKAKAAKEKQAAKKDAKLKKQQEIQNLINEIDEDKGKINKVGATIVFIMFFACAIVVIVGTNILTYNKSIEDAKTYFAHQYYNKAFDSVYGLDIKDDDIEIYDKVITVMYVNKHLNSYQNYYDLKMYPEALNSLLKGLVVYDKYYSVATILDITSDLENLRNTILIELDEIYGISEKEADDIISYKDRVEYSNVVYRYANELQQQLSKEEGDK